MKSKEIPMVPGRKISLPVIYGDTPSFLGCAVLKKEAMETGFDVIVAGVPYEGAVTWGSFSGCELAPRSIRHASARYGGFLPEYGVDIFEHLRIGDLGDIPVNPNDPGESMQGVFQTALMIYENHSIPVMLGGDHSFSPEVVRALGECGDGEIGVVHFDSHLDNSRSFGDDEFPRCSPLYRIAKNSRVRNESIVHVGIRGPRNSPSQMEFAKQIGARIMTMKEIRDRGIEAVIEEAIETAKEKTRYQYLTICSDILDGALNPGGPPDFDGLTPHELFHAVYELGASGIDGMDYVEIYPSQDPRSTSSHLAAWAIIYALAGLAKKKSACKSQGK